MASSISNLFVTLSLDAEQFKVGLQNAKVALTTIGAEMLAVGTATTTAFIAMAKQSANYGDAIRDASIRTGLSTEALSGLKFAAEQTGTSFEAINTGLVRMSRNALTA